MMSEGEGMVGDDLNINKPWILAIQGLAEVLGSCLQRYSRRKTSGLPPREAAIHPLRQE
jgi:hypothetical protein